MWYRQKELVSSGNFYKSCFALFMQLKLRFRLGYDEKKSKNILKKLFRQYSSVCSRSIRVDVENIRKIQLILPNIIPTHRSYCTYHDLNDPSSMCMDARCVEI